MFRLMQAEFLKLRTIRSTYVLLGICLAVAGFFSFYVFGYRSLAPVVNMRDVGQSINFMLSMLTLLVLLIAALLVTHEYRYNTITYSLTSANDRLKLMFAKVVAVSILAILAVLALAAVSYLLAAAGVSLKGNAVSWEGFKAVDIVWRLAFYSWGSAMFALIFAFLIRNTVGTIAALVLLPGTIEGLLGLLLRENIKYLPFTALDSILNGMLIPNRLSPGTAAAVAIVYIAGGLVIAAWLFKKRDAN